MARIELWNGDICDLEVDAIVNPANVSLWMSTGVSGAIKRAGGDAVEFAALRQAPVPLGEAIVTAAGMLACRAVIHAVSLDRDRRTNASTIEAAVRSAMARAREMAVGSIAFPALGTGVGGFPLREAAEITVRTVRDELERSPDIAHVTFAMRGTVAYEAFREALAASEPGSGAAGVAQTAVPHPGDPAQTDAVQTDPAQTDTRQANPATRQVAATGAGVGASARSGVSYDSLSSSSGAHAPSRPRS